MCSSKCYRDTVFRNRIPIIAALLVFILLTNGVHAENLPEDHKKSCGHVPTQSQTRIFNSIIKPFYIGKEFAFGFEFSCIESFTEHNIVFSLANKHSSKKLFVILSAPDTTGKVFGTPTRSFRVACVPENRSTLDMTGDEIEIARKIIELININDNGHLPIKLKPDKVQNIENRTIVLSENNNNDTTVTGKVSAWLSAFTHSQKTWRLIFLFLIPGIIAAIIIGQEIIKVIKRPWKHKNQ